MRDRERPKTLRCAIYTRKSSDEGLEQDFNSLHAQREACDAYIKSQVHEGWKAVPTAYDDGGYSGGTMERPGLKALLADIHAKLIDVVVVYKVDRLTRALNDFARIVEVFDGQGVSFVSVTQQFNTTTSMGRLTLNVLLSFAQFEREVTGERIRDKIAASKKKGMWMGGVVPLGYDAKDRTLAINEPDAALVREIFRRYLELGSVLKLEGELEHRGIRTKRFVTVTGRVIGDRIFSRGHLYKLLSNPVYLGEIRHRDIRHPGLHEAIVDRQTWDAVQAQLTSNGRARLNGTTAGNPSLLAGLLFDASGRRLVATHATKNGKRYRYYVCETKKGAGDEDPKNRPLRIPAGEIEPAVVTAIVSALRSEKTVLEGVGDVLEPSVMKALLSAAARLANTIKLASGMELKTLLSGLVDGIRVSEQVLGLRLRSQMVAKDLASTRSAGAFDGSIAVACPFSSMADADRALVVEGPESAKDPDTGLNQAGLKSVARGFVWFEELTSSRARSLEEIARREDVTDRYVSRLIDRALDYFSVSAGAIADAANSPKVRGRFGEVL